MDETALIDGGLRDPPGGRCTGRSSSGTARFSTGSSGTEDSSSVAPTTPTVALQTTEQLNALVAPIALYPDALVAQICGRQCRSARLLRRELLDSAIAIWECADGADALAAYADRQPDIVLMDVGMPRMDGPAATRQIREFHRGARVVIVTDYDDEDLRKAALEAGAHGYVLKQNLSPTLAA